MTQYDETNKGALFRNERRENDRQPTHTGPLNVEGVEYWISAWTKESKAGKKFFSLSVKRKEGDTRHTSRPAPAYDRDAPLDDEVPW
jgi:hypothetical protein